MQDSDGGVPILKNEDSKFEKVEMKKVQKKRET